MELDPRRCYSAPKARDARFDGRFFVAAERWRPWRVYAAHHLWASLK